jgi:hypothetical protein
MKTPKSLLVVLIDILGEQHFLLFPTWLPNEDLGRPNQRRLVEKLFECAFGKVGSAKSSFGGGA